MPQYVGVVGPGSDAGPTDRARAREVGRLLATRGAVVLTGGLGGVMAAAADGASTAGGLSVGMLPGSDRRAGNASTVLLPTGLGELRNALLVHAADGIVAVGGSWGTLSEIALARRTGVPVVCLGGWSVLAADGTPVPIESAATAEDAVDRILAQIAASIP
ncbi:MAG: hypothetical protein JWO57_1074 [Pseudonocardiales bacterium]|nr:hypothetical protein [Pseudonocardiales bacterium]